ncbi:MAG: hypothetical protein V2I36_05450 [Desulfopila sp.]|nr:hypothetical protein [Desulfopila sp.]
MHVLINIAGGTLFFLFCLTALPFSCHAGEGNDLNGITTRPLWRVDGFIPKSNSTIGKNEILSYQGRSLDMVENAITFDGRSCSPIIIKRYQADTARYLSQQLHIHPKDAEYHSPTLEVIKTNCHIEGFDEFVRLNDRRLLVPVGEVVLVFLPIVNY